MESRPEEDDERPQVVVLRDGDLTAEQAEAFEKGDPIDEGTFDPFCFLRS